MKSDSISIDNQGSGFEAALSQTEAAAKFRGLNDREALRLRILTEELLGMVKSITGQMAGTFWIDSEERAFTLHLSTKTKMDALKRYQFISTSTENRNEAARGFLGFLRDRFETAMMAEENLVCYDSQASARPETVGEEEWDRYERSILRRLSDGIRISVRGGQVEMEVQKKF